MCVYVCCWRCARSARARRLFFFVIVDFPLEGAHATTREGVYCCLWPVSMYGLMGARDVRSYAPLLMFDWNGLTPPRGMLHVVVDVGVLDDDVCVYAYFCLLLASRARASRARRLFFFGIVDLPFEGAHPPRWRSCVAACGAWRCMD